MSVPHSQLTPKNKHLERGVIKLISFKVSLPSLWTTKNPTNRKVRQNLYLSRHSSSVSSATVPHALDKKSEKPKFKLIMATTTILQNKFIGEFKNCFFYPATITTTPMNYHCNPSTCPSSSFFGCSRKRSHCGRGTRRTKE